MKTLKERAKNIYLRCSDNAETVVFTRYDWDFKNGHETDFEINIEDAYCGGDYMGITGRFKRAWKAFWAKPVYYAGVYCEDTEQMRNFLNECLALTEKSDN